MTFHHLALVASVVAAGLGLGFLFAGRAMLAAWGLDPNDAALVVSRRIGAVYLGIACMLGLGHAAPPSPLRTALCLGLGAAIALLALLGLYERSAHRVHRGIYLSVVVETLLASAFFACAWMAP